MEVAHFQQELEQQKKLQEEERKQREEEHKRIMDKASGMDSVGCA